jgi:hypothetical protein
MTLPRVHLLFASALALAAMATAAPPPPAQITVGQGEAWVRLHFPPSGESELRTIRWENPPDGLDPSTIRVWTPKRPAPLADWHWLDGGAPVPADPAAPLVWTPRTGPLRSGTPPSNRPRPLELRLAEPLSDAMGHSLTFRIPGFAWSARYHLTVRGLGATSLKQAQIDLDGTVRIENPTATAWPGARLSFAGPRDAPPAALAAAKPVGLPALDRDSPLAAPWFPPDAPEPPVPAWWPLRLPADLPAGDRADVAFLHVRRKPAQIVHVYDSAAVPLPTPEPGVPLERRLLVPNTPEMGLGFPLLPGRLDWTLGTRTAHPSVQTVPVPATPYPGTLSVPMGPVGDIRAVRAARPPVDYPDGTRQLDVILLFANDLDGEADLQAAERPPFPAWNLVSSSAPCTAGDDVLRFSLVLPPRSRTEFRYRIRLPAPR